MASGPGLRAGRSPVGVTRKEERSSWTAIFMSNIATIEEFTQHVLEHLPDHLPDWLDGIELSTEKVVKDGRRVTGLSARHPSTAIVPLVYLDFFLPEINGCGRSLESVTREIADTVSSTMSRYKGVGPMLAGYEEAKPRLAIRLFDLSDKRGYLSDKVYTDLGGLAASYRFIVGSVDGDETASVPIDNRLLSAWGISAQQVKRDTAEVENATNPVLLYDTDALCEAGEGEVSEDRNMFTRDRPLRNLGALYVLTTRRHLNGASAIARPGVLEKVARLFGRSYYVVPASTHELFLAPDNGSPTQLRVLEQQIQEDIAHNLRPEDVLSDQIFYYDRRARKLKRRSASNR